MENVVRKRDDFVVDSLFYFEPVQRFKYRGDVQFVGSLLHEHGSFAVTVDEIFVLAISLGKLSYNSLI